MDLQIVVYSLAEKLLMEQEHICMMEYILIQMVVIYLLNFMLTSCFDFYKITYVHSPNPYPSQMSKQEFIDKYLNKAVSKKLTVFVVACYFAFMGKITGSEWIIIATAYIGIVAFTETVLRLKDK